MRVHIYTKHTNLYTFDMFICMTDWCSVFSGIRGVVFSVESIIHIHIRDPPNRETQNPQYLAAQIQIENWSNLNLYQGM